MRFIPLSVALICSSWFIQPATAADGQYLLQRLSEAQRNQSFQGTFVYDSNGVFLTHAVWSLVDRDGHAHIRLQRLDGSEQEVLSVDGQVECANGVLAEQLTQSQLWPVGELDSERLNEWYEPVALGDSRVAGRATTVLALIPRDEYRYGLKLHLDRQTGLLLKSLLVNERGQLLERFQYTRISLEPPSQAALQPGGGCRAVQAGKLSAGSAQGLKVDWLPPGFTLSSVSNPASAASGGAVRSQVYTDGLASFSVFIEPLKGAVAGDLRTQLGPTAAASHRIETDDGDVMVTVVGEIPLAAAERIAAAVQLPAGDAQ